MTTNMKQEIGFIGLGRMGSALAAHLLESGFIVHGFDTDIAARHAAMDAGIDAHATIEDFLASFTASPKIVWIMVPSRFAGEAMESVAPFLLPGDTVIDGGNSFFKDSIARHDRLEERGIGFIDCGTSGGVLGARHGASLMLGGDPEVIRAHDALFKALSAQDGYAHVGASGAGHFVKMVHNAIEYGMMGAIAEGVNVLHEHAEGLGIDLLAALRSFENGSIIESRLVAWLAKAYATTGYLEHIAGEVPKGETEMEMEYLTLHEDVKVLNAALLQRKRTRTTPSFIGTLIAAMRKEFGGHQTKEK